MQTMHAYRLSSSGNWVEVETGEVLESNGSKSDTVFVRASRLTVPGKSGKVEVRRGSSKDGYTTELYAHIFDLSVAHGMCKHCGTLVNITVENDVVGLGESYVCFVLADMKHVLA